MKKRIITSVLSLAVISTSFADNAKKVETKKLIKSTKQVSGHSFEVKIKNGHLGKVILGVDAKATDGYDRGLDDMAPPPGMQTGYTALVSADKKSYLYRDTRKSGDSIEWIFYSKVYKKKAVVISWDKTKLLPGYKLVLEHGDDTIDMSKKSSLTLSKTTALLIIATKIKK
ncbi:MAG: hypothetical protein KAG98_01525 [Lentisphaeria bacterium]|nr:hypothetical protein [Lentisphaeria bacterium]